MTDTGQSQHSADEYVEAVREHHPAGTKEVADTVGVKTQSADYRLRKLEDDGRVESKKVGRTLIWMIPD